MTVWRRWVPIAILAVCAATGCKDKKKDAATTQATTADLDKQCQHLAAACGDQGKHVDKIANECKQGGARQAEKGCTAKAVALYSCYEKELCGKSDKVWALDDLRVLGERQSKCVAERSALGECLAK